MLDTDIPVKFPIPWANAAGGSYIRAVPVVSQIGITPGAASLTDGFVPLNMTPPASGGIPPFGQDTNGILKQITQWNQWQQAGAPVFYDGTFSTAIGGYPKGAMLMAAAGGGWWVSTVDNNVSDPDTGGGNWLFLNISGALIQTLVYNSHGSFAPSFPLGTRLVDVTIIGAGASGGGAPLTSSSQGSAGSGGGPGAYFRGIVPIATITGLTLTLAQGAAPGAAGSNGITAAASTLGSIISVPGGLFGSAGPATAGPALTGSSSATALPTWSGSVTPLEYGIGQDSDLGFVMSLSNVAGGKGGSSVLGGGGTSTSNSDGDDAQTPGSGGSGGSNLASQSARPGGRGADAYAILRAIS